MFTSIALLSYLIIKTQRVFIPSLYAFIAHDVLICYYMYGVTRVIG